MLRNGRKNINRRYDKKEGRRKSASFLSCIERQRIKQVFYPHKCSAMIGPIRRELLSSITIKSQFDALKEKLLPFEDIPLTGEDYERAAEFYNICRKSGIQGSQIDFLICAVAAGREIPIFTTDNDFLLYAKHLTISLHHPANTTS